MFSFRTTPLDEQEDMVLRRGNIAVLCNQAAWNPEKEEYLFETIFRNGNLKKVLYPSSGLFGETGGQENDYAALGMPDVTFVPVSGDGSALPRLLEQLEGMDALLVEYQDTGSRYDRFTALLFNLFQLVHHSGLPLSVYVLDRENPCGRWVEGTPLVPGIAGADAGVEGIPHRHGLTLGELSNLFYSEIGARFPLHIISYLVRSATQYMMPWSIPPFQEVPGLFTFGAYCGLQLLEGTDISYGIGTTRPYEMFGAPYLSGLLKFEISSGEETPARQLADPGVFLRKVIFTPRSGIHAGQKCYGYQILPRPGVPYHSVAHVLRILKYIGQHYPQADFSGLDRRMGDEVFSAYLSGTVDWTSLKEHIKVEEQKWTRKAKRYMLYDEQLSRVKTLV